MGKRDTHDVTIDVIKDIDGIQLLQQASCDRSQWPADGEDGCDNECHTCMFDVESEEAISEFTAMLEEGGINVEITAQ